MLQNVDGGRRASEEVGKSLMRQAGPQESIFFVSKLSQQRAMKTTVTQRNVSRNRGDWSPARLSNVTANLLPPATRSYVSGLGSSERRLAHAERGGGLGVAGDGFGERRHAPLGALGVADRRIGTC